MSFVVVLYNKLLWQPLFNGLVWFYTVLPWQDLGLAIIALTIVIRVVLTPLLLKGQRAQKDLARIQPEIKKIQEQFKNNREAQGKAMMELYAHHKVNPFSGCVIALIQFPILIALFSVFRKGLNPTELGLLYSFVKNPHILNPLSFGILNLSKGNIYLGIVAAITQYFYTKLTVVLPKTSPGDKKDFSQALQWQTLYVFPAIILLWSYTLPSALTLYWTALNIFGILQEVIVRALAQRKEKNGPTVQGAKL